MRISLLVAGIYNVIWGTSVVVFPTLAFDWAGIDAPRYPQIWQCVGMIVGVYGIGYWIASLDPFRHWAIVLVGLLGKILGPIGFVFAAVNEQLPWSWAAMILFNDVIWWAPFGLILYHVFKNNSNTEIGQPHNIEDAVVLFPGNRGKCLAELSQQQPLMIVFLRHFGCTFCREALRDLARTRKEIEAMGISVVLVHMGDADDAAKRMQKFGLNDVDQFSDSTCEIYRAFGVERGSLRQLLGVGVIWKGMLAMLRGNGIGTIAGDGFRLPGLFLMHRGRIQGSIRHQSAADRPDYVKCAQRFRQLLHDEAQGVSV